MICCHHYPIRVSYTLNKLITSNRARDSLLFWILKHITWANMISTMRKKQYSKSKTARMNKSREDERWMVVAFTMVALTLLHKNLNWIFLGKNIHVILSYIQMGWRMVKRVKTEEQMKDKTKAKKTVFAFLSINMKWSN